MRKRWIVLAIVFGLAAASATSYWPSSPLWRNTYTFNCAVEGFTSDSREVFIIEQAFTDTPSTAPLRLHRCDADTGKSLGVVDLPHPDSTKLMETKLSADATTLLLLMMKEKQDSNDLQVIRSYFYFLHDARTGSKLAGPIPFRATPGLFFTVSANCQWLWINNVTASDTRDGFDVLEACTGRLVLRVRRQGAAAPLSLRFASDNSAAAVLWKNSCRDHPAAYFVKIIDLPSGKERRRVNLPASPWPWTDLPKWDGNHLYAEVSCEGFLTQTFSFDVNSPLTGGGKKEPLLTTDYDRAEFRRFYWDTGPGWLAHISVGPYRKTRIDELVKWLSSAVGMKYEDREFDYTIIRFIDPDTGELRYEIPKQLRSCGCVISPNGKRLTAWAYSGNMVEVWDADPPPRWPWSAVAGALAVGSTSLFGRWRRKQESLPRRSAEEPTGV